MYTKLSLPLILFILFYLFASLATQEELLVIIGVLSVLIVIGIVLVYLDVANKRKINEEKFSKVSTPQADDSGPDCMQVISNKLRIAAGLAQSIGLDDNVIAAFLDLANGISNGYYTKPGIAAQLDRVMLMLDPLRRDDEEIREIIEDCHCKLRREE